MRNPIPFSHLFTRQTDMPYQRALLSVGAVFLSISLVTIVSQTILSGSNLPILVASMGASAVLLFMVPSSRLSTPWAFVGGHLVSAIIGVSAALWIPHTALAAACAVAGAILAMHYLHCLHPPGGAAALLAVTGGESIHALGFQFVLVPVLLNVVIMLILTLLYWRLVNINQQRQEHASASLDHNWQRDNEDWLATQVPFNQEELARAVAEMDTFIDTNQHDLLEIYSRALQLSHGREFGDMRCAEVMTQPVISVQYGTELEEAWKLFEKHNIRGLPVVDSFQHVIGIVTVSDFVNLANDNHNLSLPESASMSERLIKLRQRTEGFESEKVEVVGQIMESQPIIAREDETLIEKIGLFSQYHIHHLPVVNRRRKLVGMLTREDIMAARASLSAPQAQTR